MKRYIKILVFSIAFAAIYIIGSVLLASTELSFRMWVDVLGKVWILWVLPLLVIIGIWLFLRKKGLWKPVVKVLYVAVSTAVYAVVCLWFGLLILIFSTNEERRLTSDLLATGNSDFLEWTTWVYERPVAIFFKTPTEATAEDKKEYLEKKYGRTFEVWDSLNHIFIQPEFPEVKTSVELSGGEFRDDFFEKVLAWCLTEGAEALGIQREHYISENGIFYIGLTDESDIPAFAEDVSRLTAYVCRRTDFFEENRGYLYFFCKEGEGELTGQIPFGKLGQWDDMEPEYYLNPEKLGEYVREKYETLREWKAEYENASQDTAALDGTSGSADSGSEDEKSSAEDCAPEDSATKDNAAASTEDCALTLYDAVFKEQGYPCNLSYTAKGNLYLDLGSRDAGQEGDALDTGTYRFTLVYDRPSKNGACELFVLYKEHYTEKDGQMLNDATQILDMYAVEKTTGKTVASGRHAWSDVGSREYRDLTGE